MVVGVLAALVGMVKVRYSHTAVDSHVFRLHYRWTTAFFFASCALLSAHDYIGGAIECIANGHKQHLKQITTYCWISSTYTINITGGEIKGIGHYNPNIHEKTFYTYYQWVAVVLFMQGCVFYLPHLIWKSYEGKQVAHLLQGLNTLEGLFDKDMEVKKKNIINYLKESWGLNTHYATIYHLCEAFNLVSVVSQMFIINKFLGGLFMDYGTKVLGLMAANDGERHDALISTFPRLTKCQYKYYGPGGDPQPADVLCVLPQNIINEKIFLLMWVWFVVLTTITSAWLVWRAAVLYSPWLRIRILEQLAKCEITSKMEQTINSLHIGDFCLLENIGYNLDILKFKDILQGVTDAVEEYTPNAPVEGGTYRPFYTPNDIDTLPRHRHLGFADTSL